VGKALVDRVIHWAKQAHVSKIGLWVNCENVVLQFTAVAASMTQELLPSFLPSRMRLKRK